jgi:hypothetical protein
MMKALAVRGDLRSTVGPMGADGAEPLIDLTAQETVFRLNPTTQLVAEPARDEDREDNSSGLDEPALPG